MLFTTWKCSKCGRTGKIDSEGEKCNCGGKVVKVSADIGAGKERRNKIRAIVFGKGKNEGVQG